MYEASRTDFKPAEGDLPDTLSRLNLDEVKVNIKKYGDGDIMNVAMGVLAVVVFLLGNIIYTSYHKKKEEEANLSQETKLVNQQITTLDKSDIQESNKLINEAYSLQNGSSQYLSIQPNMSKAEKILKKKTPHIEVFDPDAKN